MPKTNEFVEHLLDLLAPLRGVSARSMFGGWGMYFEGNMFALVAFDTFYVKADTQNLEAFTSRKLKPFIYETDSGKQSKMSYYTVPAEALDSTEILCQWAQLGIEAAARAACKKGKKKAR
jgi:DNA transformation protein and related proteins